MVNMLIFPIFEITIATLFILTVGSTAIMISDTNGLERKTIETEIISASSLLPKNSQTTIEIPEELKIEIQDNKNSFKIIMEGDEDKIDGIEPSTLSNKIELKNTQENQITIKNS